ncbi:fumarylacetoacetase [Spirosoma taeanense]|uniref:fumarylacetoacetase n=1 Tax=Spirosoma taeanense TaxID=2735870 RepID=A0A6M5YDH9_9BACT|nr:fumarylacetoacetase [Spirosoma taeanense]QJW91386.1 fumarylacetoacetase [Spirosoma taeanense]
MYGIFSYDIASPRVGFKHRDHILDLEVVGLLGYFSELNLDPAVFARPTLNDFMKLGKPTWQAVNHRIKDLLSNENVAFEGVHDQVLIRESRAMMHLPVRIGDYTDFYAGIHHAENVGRMFRPDGEPLLPNYKQMPVAYHGRASSIVVSGTPIRRPQGQFMQGGKLTFGPSQALDFELELGLIIGKESRLGQPVSIADAEDYVFGLVLFNDWSARDIQRWEYQPLGPFLGKNFGSSMSAWVVPFEDLHPFRVESPRQEPALLPYLQSSPTEGTISNHFDLTLEVLLNDVVISQTNARYLYWSFAQMIAHHTVNGCNLNVGDVLASGTISGTEPGSYGSLLELSWNGERPLVLPGETAEPEGRKRTFLQDGDTVTMRGISIKHGHTLKFGEVTGTIQPSAQ